MAATRWLPAGGGSDGGAEVLDDVGDDALWPPFCEQPSPSQMPKYHKLLHGLDQQDDGSLAAEEGGAQPEAGASQLPADGGLGEQQGSENGEAEEDAAGDAEGELESSSAEEGKEGEDAEAGQEGGNSGWEGAAQREQERHKSWFDPNGPLPAWVEARQPSRPAPPGGLLAARESLAVLPDTPDQLTFAVRAAAAVRGDPTTREVPPPGQLPPDQNNSQHWGVSQDKWASQPPPSETETMLLSVGADAGDGYYLFRMAMQAQVDELWELAVQLEAQLAEATAALEQQREGEQGDGSPALEAVAQLREALHECQQKLEAAVAEKEQLLATSKGEFEQANKAAAEREAELQRQVEHGNATAAAREAKLQRRLEQANMAAAAREAKLQRQLEQAAEAAAEQGAEHRQQLEQARQQAEEVGEENRRLRQQLAELQRTRQQELAEAEEQQEAAAAELKRLAAEARDWEARCQAAEQHAAQRPSAAADSERAVEQDATVAECRRLQQELAAAQEVAAGLQQRNAALQQQNAALQATSAQVLAQVEEVTVAAEAHVQGSGGQLSREQRQELRRFLTDTNYQHAKLGGAFPPLHALRSPKFWRGVAEGLQAPWRLVQEEGARMLAELALAGQRVVEAELRETRQSERVALKQAKRMSAVVEAHRAAAARRAAAGQGATSAADGGQQQQELQDEYDMWELLVELNQREQELLETQNELEREREASSCKAWQVAHEAEAQRDAACLQVRQLEAQLVESRGNLQQLREVAAALRCQLEDERAAKQARCAAAEPAEEWVLDDASDSWEDSPAGSEAEQAVNAATARMQAAEHRHLAEQATGSQAAEPTAPTASTQRRPAEQGEAAEQPGSVVDIEPAAAAAQLQHDAQQNRDSPPAADRRAEPEAAASSTRHPLMQCRKPQGQPAGWQQLMTQSLIDQHGAFAALMAQALAMEDASDSSSGAQRESGSRKRGRDSTA